MAWIQQSEPPSISLARGQMARGDARLPGRVAFQPFAQLAHVFAAKGDLGRVDARRS
jgi:hypothetical protein